MQTFRYDIEQYAHAKSTMLTAAILFVLAALFLLWGQMHTAAALYVYVIVCALILLVFLRALRSRITMAGRIETDGSMIRYIRRQTDITIRFDDICHVEFKGCFFPYFLLQSNENSIRVYKTLYDYPALLGLLHKYIRMTDIKTADISHSLFKLQNPQITLISLTIPVVILLAIIGTAKGSADFWTIILLLIFFCIAFGVVAVNIAGSFHRLVFSEKVISYRTLFNKWEVQAEHIADISLTQVHKRILTGYNKEKTLKHKKLPPPVGYGLALEIHDKAGAKYIISDAMTYYHLELILAYMAKRYDIPICFCRNNQAKDI